MTGNVSVPTFAQVFGRGNDRPPDWIGLITGLAFAAVTTAIYATLGLVFDPRFRDFPDAALTASIAPFALLFAMRPQRSGTRPLAELIAAASLAASAIYIALNESLANWQALWFAAALFVLSFTLAQVRDGQSSTQ